MAKINNEKTSINFDKLKGKIKEVVGTQSKFAEYMGWNEATATNKLNNITYFTQPEILKACSILHIDYDKIPEYFFENKVREHE